MTAAAVPFLQAPALALSSSVDGEIDHAAVFSVAIQRAKDDFNVAALVTALRAVTSMNHQALAISALHALRC